LKGRRAETPIATSSSSWACTPATGAAGLTRWAVVPSPEGATGAGELRRLPGAGSKAYEAQRSRLLRGEPEVMAASGPSDQRRITPSIHGEPSKPTDPSARRGGLFAGSAARKGLAASGHPASFQQDLPAARGA
jgi:hypothetical protein